MILHWWPQGALLHRMYRPVREYDAPLMVARLARASNCSCQHIRRCKADFAIFDASNEGAMLCLDPAEHQ